MVSRPRTSLAQTYKRRKFYRILARRIGENHQYVREVESKLSRVSVALVVIVVCEVLFVLYLGVTPSGGDSEEVDEWEHGVRAKRASAVSENTVLNQESEVNVEFINPKLRAELEEREKNVSRGQGDNDPWVRLTSTSRVPMVAIEGFCRAAKDYCPPGPPGTPGPPGPVGPRGDSGYRGEKGEIGGLGETGPRGFPGDKGPQGPPGLRGPPGSPGSPGLDGRDGIPGEPGLDGIPGRNGLDGMPGINGLPGRNGTDGIPGANGYNGTKGETGSTGPTGPAGPRGIAGPRGRSGKPGMNGNHGLPGVQAWGVTINGTRSSELLIPPKIVGGDAIFVGGPISVKERDNVRLRCAASGHPTPTVQWRRLDTSTIALGSWKDSALLGHLLNITRVRRDHMGTYMCVAENGVPPPANHTFILEVKFAPTVTTVGNQHIREAVGHNTSIKCLVEAFPEAVRYWKKDNNQLLESDNKYSISIREDPNTKYKSEMELYINNIQPSNFGQYQCVAKNEIGKAVGGFQMDELDRSLARPPIYDEEGVPSATYGSIPPEPVDLDDLCPPPEKCQTCPDPKKYSLSCKSGLYSVHELLGYKDLEVRPLQSNTTYPGQKKRELNCLVYAVGKAVYHRLTDSIYGSWMRDPGPAQMEFGEATIWTTNETDPGHLYEFYNKTTYRQNIYARKYELMHHFMGSAHVVFNGSFYYNENNKKKLVIVRYELMSRLSFVKDLPHAAIDNQTALYTEQHNYVDFAVDDNGLWVIYGLKASNNTVVLKLDEKSLDIQNAWNISVVHRKAGEMFIVCGVLYVVDSITETTTNIRFAFDLYTNNRVEVDIPFTNPFRKTTMIGYNFKNKELYTWDRGNQLTYPIRYHDQGLANLTSLEDKGSNNSSFYNRTGFEIETLP